jgi:hypothetical protein
MEEITWNIMIGWCAECRSHFLSSEWKCRFTLSFIWMKIKEVATIFTFFSFLFHFRSLFFFAFIHFHSLFVTLFTFLHVCSLCFTFFHFWQLLSFTYYHNLSPFEFTFFHIQVWHSLSLTFIYFCIYFRSFSLISFTFGIHFLSLKVEQGGIDLSDSWMDDIHDMTLVPCFSFIKGKISRESKGRFFSWSGGRDSVARKEKSRTRSYWVYEKRGD